MRATTALFRQYLRFSIKKAISTGPRGTEAARTLRFVPTMDATVFELTPNSGTWTEKVLYAFGDGSDGGFPEGSLFVDKAGNLYGLAAGGGDLSACGGHGCGAVFELSPGSGGVWSESIAYAFLGGTDGQLPEGRLTVSWTGHLFGVTEAGGQACNCGTVFALSPVSGVVGRRISSTRFQAAPTARIRMTDWCWTSRAAFTVRRIQAALPMKV